MQHERINLIVHQYLGTIRDSMVDSHKSNIDFVASMPGFDQPAMIPVEDIPEWLYDLNTYMDGLL